MAFIYLKEEELSQHFLDKESQQRVLLFKKIIKESFPTGDYVSHITPPDRLEKIVRRGLNSFTRAMTLGIVQKPTAQWNIQKKDFYTVSFCLNTLYWKIPTETNCSLVFPIHYVLTDQTYLGFENGSEIKEKEIALLPKHFF